LPVGHTVVVVSDVVLTVDEVEVDVVDGMHVWPDGQMDVVNSVVVVVVGMDVEVVDGVQLNPIGQIVVDVDGIVEVLVDVDDGTHVWPDGHIVVVE
jgi:hypothetical protein